MIKEIEGYKIIEVELEKYVVIDNDSDDVRVMNWKELGDFMVNEVLGFCGK